VLRPEKRVILRVVCELVKERSPRFIDLESRAPSVTRGRGG